MQNSASEEMDNAQRDVPRAILRVGILMVILYSLFLLAILIALPTNQLSAAGNFLDAFQTVKHLLPTPHATGLGWLVALGFAVSLIASAVTILMAANRTYAIAALDRAALLRLGHFSRRFGTSTKAATLLGILATVTVIASIGLSALGSQSIEVLFVQVLNVAISTALLAYLLMFPSCLILRYKFPVLPHRYLVPGGIVVVP